MHESLAVGSSIAGRFVVEVLAGSGGMGEVYRVHDRETGRPAALKLLRAGGLADGARFARESAILASLDHPGIVRHVAQGTAEDGAPFLAMEWVEGQELGKWLRGRTLSVAEALAVVRAVAEALAAAHAIGIVHRDVKPSNVIIGRDGHVTLVDFGVAQLADKARLTRVGDVVGTPSYMSPEQARAEPTDARSDVFSLGCVLYKCLTGASPFGGGDVLGVMAKILLQDPPPPSESDDRVPPEVDALVARMLAKEADQRPESCAAVVAAIDALSHATVPTTRRLGDVERSLFSVLLVGRSAGSIEAMRAIVSAQGATLEVLQGGDIVVVPSREGSVVDRARRAARTALLLRQAASAPMALAIGLGVGGGSLPAGDVIDRGVRLLRQGHDGVSVDEDTAGLIESAFEIVRDGENLELVAERAPFEATRTILGKSTPFVGRARELDFLERTVIESMEESTAAWIWITASPGTGKTRLSYELVRALSGRPLEILSARADAPMRDEPYAFVGELLRRASGLRGDEPRTVREQKLRARLERGLSSESTSETGSYLGELVAAPLHEGLELVAARRDPARMSAGLARAFDKWLAAEVTTSPLLLLLEDAQYVDEASHRLLASTFARLERAPLIVIALTRGEARSVAGASTIALRPLARSAALQLVESTLGEPVEGLVDTARGNPLHLEELIRAHHRGDEHVSLLAAMQGRIDALDGASRRILRAASVFGDVAPVAGIAAIAAADPSTALRALDVAEAIVLHDEEATFVSGSFRDAVYATLTDEDRVLAHRLAGEWLEIKGDAHPAVLANHFALAVEDDKEAHYAASAAQVSFRRNDVDLAIAWAERALSLDPEAAAMYVVIAEAKRQKGAFASGHEAACSGAACAALGTAVWFDAVASRAALAGLLGRYDEVAVLVDELLSVPARDDGRDARRNALARAALAYLPAGRMGPVDRALAELDADPPRLEVDPDMFARVEGLRGSRASYAGDALGYLRASEAAASAFEKSGNGKSACIQRVHVGYASIGLGDYARAEIVLREATAAARELGLPNIEAAAAQNLGVALARTGRSEEALAVLGGAMVVFEAQDDLAMVAATHLYLAEASYVADDLDAAGASIDRALGCGDVPTLRAAVLALRARVSLARGDVENAMEDAEAAAKALASVEGVEEGQASVRLALVATSHAIGHPEAAAWTEDAASRLHAQAAWIDDPRLRASFLAIREHALLLELADSSERTLVT